MALEKIIKKILSEGKAEAQSILDSAHKEAQEIISQEEQKTKEKKDIQIREAHEGFLREKQKNLALAKLESRKKILQSRLSLLDEVFARAEEELCALRSDGHRKLIQNLLSGFQPDAPCDIFVNEPDVDKYTLLLSTLWGVAFTKFCKVIPLEKSIKGGFILRTRAIEFDCTYEHLIRERRQNLEQEVAALLFSENGKRSQE